MNTQAHPLNSQLKESGLQTALSLNASGALEVLRISKPMPVANGDLLFSGTPGRTGSHARSIQVTFLADGIPPSPQFDAATGRIHLFYAKKDHPEVQGLLNSKRNRFCYFWRSAHGDQTHAWLLSSQ